MKRLEWSVLWLVIPVFLLVLPWAALAGVKKAYVFSLFAVKSSGMTVYGISGVTTASGVTTPVAEDNAGNSGVSPMARRSGKVPDALLKDVYTVDISKSNGLFSARIKDLGMSQIHVDPLSLLTGLTDYSSGVSNSFYVKVASENTSAAWDAAEFLPVYINQAINSGTSPFPVFFQLPQTEYLRGYFLPTGVTPYGVGEVEVVEGYDINRKDQFSPILIKSLVYSLNGNSGVSTTGNDDNSVDLPEEAQYAEMYVSGNSVFYTKDNSTLVKATAMTLQNRDYRELDRRELVDLQMEAINATTVRLDVYTAKP